MTKWTPKEAPVGQVPSGIFQVKARRGKRGRPKRKVAPLDSLAESGTPSPASEPTESPGSAKTASGMSANESQPDEIMSSSVLSSPDGDETSTTPAPTSPFTKMRDKARYSSPRQMPSMREVHKFGDFTKRFHSSPDIRLAGDVSHFHPPSDGPKNLQGPPNPVRTPGIEVRKEPMRPHRRQMSDEDGYFDQKVSVDALTRFFDSLPHDYTVDQHAISSRASLEWIDGPGLYPSDIRGRRLKILVPTEDINNKPDEIIWRVTYSCNGLCRTMPGKTQQQLPALATKDTFPVALFDWAKENNKDRDRLEQRRLSPRASQLRMLRILGEIDEQEQGTGPTAHAIPDPAQNAQDKNAVDSDSTAMQDKANTCGDRENHQCGDDCQSPQSSDTASADQAGKGDEEMSGDEDASADSASDHDESNESQNEQKKEEAVACGTYLMITMTNTQAQVGQCTVRMRRETHHPRPRKGMSLKMSPHIRNILHEMAGCFSMTKSRLKIWYKSTIEKNDPHVQWLKSCRNQADTSFMGQRLPGKEAWATAMKAAANPYRISSSPLAAIEILATRSPESLIAHRGPHFLGASNDDPNNPNPDVHQKGADGRERMECVIAPPLARLSAILQIFRMGMMMDTSWRNKNAWGAPVSVLVTLNEQHHMIPLAVMVSAHADHIAYEYLLREFERACRETALQVVAGTFRPEIDGVSEADLIRQCRIFIKEGLQPRFMMIDRSHAERIAIQNVLQCPIRVCQFHMMQAIGRRLKRIYSRREDRDLRTAQALDDIRACQRCDEAEQWPEYYQRLERSIRSRTPDDPDVWPIFDKYLRDEWFNDTWGPAVLDYALPSAVTRDGPWSTNNYSEACFRTFDRVFLSCRANHRLDRLILVIIDSFFPFYEDFKAGLPRADPDLQTQLFAGLNRWEVGCVHPCPLESVPAAHRDRFGECVFCVFPPKRQAIPSTTQFCGLTKASKEVCTCSYWSGTGKRCYHLWAMVAYDELGSVFDFDENVAIIEAHLRMRGIGEPPPRPRPKLVGTKRSRRSAKMAEDERQMEEQEFKEFWGEDLTGAAQSMPDSHPRMFETSHPVVDPVTPQPQLAVETGAGDSDESEGQADESPIGRRFATPASGSADTQAGGEALESDSSLDPSSWTHTKPGAPPKIVPLQPNRITRRREPIRVLDSPDLFAPSSLDPQEGTNTAVLRAPKSTLALSRKARQQVARKKPVGIKNTGNDCYISSLAQVMARVHTWDSALTHQSVRDKLADCVEYQLWMRVRESLNGEMPQEFPDLRSTLYESDLIMSPTFMGDPFDLFDRLLPHFDRKGTMEVLGDLMKVRRFTAHLCPHHDSHFENQPVSSVLVYPLRDEAPREDSITAMLSHAIKAETLEYPCNCADLPGTAKYDILSPIITLHVVWGLQRPGLGGETMRIGHPFDIPAVLPFAEAHSWQLKGVIVRYGDTTVAGHYVAIVPHNGLFWRIDDATTTLVGNVGQEAFKNAGYPVMIVYEEASAVGYEPRAEYVDPWVDFSSLFPIELDGEPDNDAAEPIEHQLAQPAPGSSSMAAPTYNATTRPAELRQSAPAFSTITPDMIVRPRKRHASPNQHPVEPHQQSQPTHPPVTVIQPLNHLRPEPLEGASRGDRSPSVQWLQERPGWNQPRFALHNPFPLVSARPPQAGLSLHETTQRSEPSTPTPQNPMSGAIPLSSKDQLLRSRLLDRNPHPTAGILPETSERSPMRTVSVTRIMERLNQSAIWKRPHSHPRQKRILWCTPDSRPENDLRGITPRPQALTELYQSLKVLQTERSSVTDLFSDGLTSGDPDTRISCDDFRRFVNPTEWFSSSLCNAACATAFCRLDRLEREENIQSINSTVPLVRYAIQLLPWVARPDGTGYPRFAGKGEDGRYTSLPWPGLGRDRSWRDRITVSVINVAYRNHFICLAVFGPDRLVIPFDGYGGMADNGLLRMRWPTLLKDRLEYELAQGWVSEADNKDWIFAFNSPELRSALGWPAQRDGHTCGPLAVAAAVLIAQGLQPNGENLGIDRTPAHPYVETWPIWLRDCILVMIMEESSHWAVARGRPLGRLAEGLSCWKWIAEIKQELNIV